MLATDRDPMLLERLNRHPFLRARVESLLGVVEDAAGDGKKADAAERRMIEESVSWMGRWCRWWNRHPRPKTSVRIRC